MKNILVCLLFALLQITPTTATEYAYRNAGYTKIPGGIPLNATILDFQGNSLSTINDNDFKNFPNLTEIHLETNVIVNISLNAFDYNYQLTHLYLSHNLLQSVPYFPVLRDRLHTINLENCLITNETWDLIIRYRNISSVVLSRNNIRNLLDFTAVNKSGMITLYLQKCGINNIPQNYFQGFDNLQYLSLGWNSIPHVTQYCFSGLPKLKRLQLHSSNVKTIHSLALQFPFLSWLKLENNHLSVFPNISALHNLELLILNDNNISGQVNASIFTGVHNKLTTIHLQNNAITKFEESALRYLPSLQTLDLSGNRYAYGFIIMN